MTFGKALVLLASPWSKVNLVSGCFKDVVSLCLILVLVNSASVSYNYEQN